MNLIFLLCVALFCVAFFITMYLSTAIETILGAKKKVLAAIAIMAAVSFIPSCVYYHVDESRLSTERTTSYLEINGYTAKIIDHYGRYGYVLEFKKTGERLVIHHIHLAVAVGDLVRLKANGSQVAIDYIVKG